MSVSRQSLNLDDLRLETQDGGLVREGAYLVAHTDTSPRHSHSLGHLVHAASGVLSLLTDDGTWIAPSNRFAWVPAGVEHSHRAHGRTDMRVVYLEGQLARALPSTPAVLIASSLAREAVLALTSGEPRSAPALDRLRRVVVDEATTAPEQPLHLPEPRDLRLRKVAREVERDLASPQSLTQIAQRIGVGARSLSRLFREETGMGYRQWRLQLRVHRALVLLAEGTTVTDTAAACGWSTTSQFIAQFSPLVGMTPGQYRARPGPVRNLVHAIPAMHDVQTDLPRTRPIRRATENC
ncbi:AraC-like DNA-binding protein [Microbacterium resistens]|uniref:AraC-like DNA-binding protein n=1 Tax=Microbacterium resistens TaxID=156977 RepID=A0ABU1SCR6_9MICO|nr:helix-turn-helix transcriptional regulator [Microbacterium resistens]MDR6867392.1 AraC-like DNA-binding protein [Microbacterium resistens]